MLAGTVCDLGISTGNDAGTFEDHTISKAVELGKWRKVKKLIAERNSTHATWAWKRPSLVLHMGEVLPLLRRPSVVMVFKDVLAVAHRKGQTRDISFPDLLTKTIALYHRMAILCQTLHCPLMVVSYEGARKDREHYVRDLASFLGIHDESRIQHALSKQQYNQSEYLRIQGGHAARRRAEQQAVPVNDNMAKVNRARF